MNGYSILVPVYNNDKYLEECLDSIQLQTFFEKENNYEILVGIDGCNKSYKKIKQIYKKYKNIKVLNMKKNMGTYVTLNTLISISTYDKIIPFGSDDIMKLNLIEVVNNFVSKYDIIKFGRCEFFNDSDKCQPKPPTDGILCFNKKILKELGGYKDWVCAADTDFIYRLKKDTRIYKYNNPLFYRRIHSESLTQKEETNMISNLRTSYISQIKRGYEYINPIINKYDILDLNTTKIELDSTLKLNFNLRFETKALEDIKKEDIQQPRKDWWIKRRTL